MSELIIALLVLGIGISAFTGARRSGMWSWKQFFIIMLGLGLICSVTALLVIFFILETGPRNAGIKTLIIVAFIGLSVTYMAIKVKPGKKPEKSIQPSDQDTPPCPDHKGP